MSAAADWIGLDWGTSRARAWLMAGPDMLEERTSEAGMNGLCREGFATAFDALCEGWPPLPVTACGMVGSRQGWVEAPYVFAPCPPPGLDRAARVPGRDIAILPGVAQARPADVMRGEETQIGGVMAARPEFDGVICLPGTHTKWAQVSAGEIVSFQTFMTGEIFALLARQSVLRHSLGDQGWDEAAFSEAVAEAMSHPAAIGARLFAIRATALLEGLAPAAARARLSGLLVGLELAGARPYWLGQRVIVVGASEPAQAYLAALRMQGVEAEAADGEAATRAGLWAARERR